MFFREFCKISKKNKLKNTSGRLLLKQDKFKNENLHFPAEKLFDLTFY